MGEGSGLTALEIVGLQGKQRFVFFVVMKARSKLTVLLWDPLDEFSDDPKELVAFVLECSPWGISA